VLQTYDPADRRLGLGPAVLATVTSVANSVRYNFRHEESSSKIVTLKALWPVKSEIRQFEPFVLAEVDDLKPDASCSPTSEQDKAIESEVESIIRLRKVLSLPLLDATADGRIDDTVAELVSVVGPERLYYRALLAAQHAMPEMRPKALELKGEQLGDYVLASLRETHARLIAKKSIMDLPR
jgi:hypothetical protein